MMLCTENYPNVLAFCFLDELQKEFITTYNMMKTNTAVRPYCFIEFGKGFITFFKKWLEFGLLNMCNIFTSAWFTKCSILHSFYLCHKRTQLGIKIFIQSLFDSQTMYSDLKITSKCLTIILFHRDLEQPNGSVLFRSNSPAGMESGSSTLMNKEEKVL